MPRSATLWLAAVTVACDGGPSIRPVPQGKVEQRGNLTLRPIVFATDDYYFAPTKVDAEQGRLRVPMRHAQPNGRAIEIHFIRFPATTEAPSYPIVYLAGGPGGSGSASAAGDRFPLFMHLRKAADVIALDQRGVRHSIPAPVCPPSWSYPLDRPLEERTLEQIIAPWLAKCAAHFRDSVDIAAFNTAESADDLEAIRRAIGADKISLWGISYGTHLALAYVRKYPDRVHRAILAGVEGPDHTWKLPRNIDLALRRVDSALAMDRDARQRIPDFLPRLRRALNELAARPATVEIEDRRTKERHRVTVGSLDLQRALFFAPGEREQIEELFTRVGRVLDGDYSPLAEFAYRTRRDNTDLVMALSMDCSAGATATRRALIASQADSAILGDIANLNLRVTCPRWPVAPLSDSLRAPFQSSVSTLAISGSMDNRTPPSNADEVLRGWPNASHLVIDGAAHDDDLFLSHKSIREAMVRFLQTGHPGTQRISLPPLRFK